MVKKKTSLNDIKVKVVDIDEREHQFTVWIEDKKKNKRRGFSFGYGHGYTDKVIVGDTEMPRWLRRIKRQLKEEQEKTKDRGLVTQKKEYKGKEL